MPDSRDECFWPPLKQPQVPYEAMQLVWRQPVILVWHDMMDDAKLLVTKNYVARMFLLVSSANTLEIYNYGDEI